MIEKCKFCGGNGFIRPRDVLGAFSGTKTEPCKVGNGSGKLDVNIDPERRVECKLCNGTGINPRPSITFGLYQPREPCENCKGLSFVEIPKIGSSNSSKVSENTITTPQTPRLSEYEFDVAVSFASENREIVEEYVKILSSKLTRVFYDKDYQVDLWGANLYDFLDDIYRNKAHCCVIFISKEYGEKIWTSHERQSAQARALKENKEYILPVKLDNTEIPGIRDTIGYIDFRKISIEDLAEITIKKVKKIKNKRS